MLSSLFQLTFLCMVQPFNTPYGNFIEVFNEMNVMLVGYFGCQLLYSSHDNKMMDYVGLSLVIVIMTGVTVNLLLVVYFMLRELKLKWLHMLKMRALKRLEKKLQAMDPSTDFRVKRR